MKKHLSPVVLAGLCVAVWQESELAKAQKSPTTETRWHGHRLQQKWTNGAGEFEWRDIAETEETMERE